MVARKQIVCVLEVGLVEALNVFNRFTFRGDTHATGWNERALSIVQCAISHKVYLFHIYAPQYSIKFHFIANSVPGRRRTRMKDTARHVMKLNDDGS